MEEFIVKSGEINAQIEALTTRMAVMKAIEYYFRIKGTDTKNMDSMISCKGKDDKEPIYFSTDVMLNIMGIRK